MVRVRAISFLLAFGLLREAHAGSRTPSLEVTRMPGAEACPDGAKIMARLQNESSWVPAASGKSDAKLVFFRSNNKYYARIEVPASASERTLESTSDGCEELAESSVLALSMLGDDTDALWPPPPPPKPPPPAPPAKPGFRATAELGARSAFLLLRPVALGAEVRIGLTHARSPFSAALGGSILPSTEISLGQGSVAVGAFFAIAEACADLVRGRDAFSYVFLCARGEFGALHAEGRGFPTQTSASRPWLALGGAIRGRLPLTGPLRIAGGFVVEAPVSKEQFQVDGVGVAYEPAPVAVSSTIGVEIVFP